MDVLMTQTTAGGSAAAAKDLRGRGHTVQVCHPDGTAVCVALAGGHCPLDHGTIDATVVVRPYGAPDALPLERGVLCAAQRGIPLIVAGDPANNPYEPWTSAEEEGSDVARTVETVVALPLPALTKTATHALRAALDNAGLPSRRARVEVRRRHGGVVAELFGLDDVTSSQAAMASVRVAGAIRAQDDWIRRVDVTRHRRSPLSD